MKFYIIIVISLFYFQTISAQIDYEFWFAAPEVSYEIVAPGTPVQNLDNPAQLYISTTEGPANVIIDEPANPAFTSINVTVATNVFQVVNLTSFLSMLENQPPDMVLNYGLRVRSDKRISCYYDIGALSNGESFVFKGRNALGREFIIPSQNTYRNYPYCNPPARNSFIIVATEDSTVIQIQPKQNIVGHAKGVLYEVLLNKGQTYCARAMGGEAVDHLGGSWVFASKPVAVTVSDDEVQYSTSDLYRDLIGDQLIPREVCDTLYISAAPWYSVKHFYAFEDNTTVSWGDIPITINRGEYAEYIQTLPLDPFYRSFHSNKPVLGYEVSGEQTMGFVLPPMSNCSGSYEFSTCNPTPNTGNYSLSLICRAADTANFIITGPIPFFNPGSFWGPVAGTNQEWYAYGHGFGAFYSMNWHFFNSTGKFHLFAHEEDWQYFMKGGYFGNFANLNLGADRSMCPGDSILLDAGNGPMTYLWSTGDTTSSIWVKSAGQYWVQTTENACTLRDTINISYYWSTPVNLGPDRSICSGDSVLLDAGTGRAWYLWSTGQSTQTIWAKNTGTYWVKVPDVHCDVYDTVNVLVSPPPSLTNNPLSKTICSGEPTNIPLTSAPGATFNWTATLTSGSITGFLADSGTVINQILVNHSAIAGVVTYTITPKLGSCIGTPADYVVTVNPGDSVNVSIASSANNICAGTSVTFTATPTGTGTLTFDWKVNGTSQGLNNPIFNYTPANGDVVTCILSSSITTCVTNNPATSNAITMVVTPVTALAVNISASQNPACSGNPVVFTALPSVSGPTNVFTWKVNGVPVGANQTTYSYSPVNGDVITCELASSEQCVTGSPVTSNSITMSVAPSLGVNVSISASVNNMCAGTSVTFTATPTNPGATPVYLWKVNGNPQGTNNSIFSYVPVNGDAVTCTLTSSITSCLSNNPATSNQIIMQVNPIVPVSISVTPSQNNICAGTQVTFTATPSGQGSTPVYLWKVNGSPVGTSQTTYSYIPANNDIITCTLTSSEQCPSQGVVTSAPVQMVVNPNLAVSVNISASNNPVCAGIPVTFTATPVNGGLTPSYQWKVNGGNVGTNQNNYTYLPINGDVITCSMTTSIASCATPTTATANPITMVISALPSVTYTICTDSITTTNARPIKLKGGIPLGGTYSGPGVNSLTGVFSPAIAGSGIKAITYTYTNAGMCTANKTKSIIVQAPAAFTCGNTFRDIRDNRDYATVQIGSQCWFAEDLAYGIVISKSVHQRDNCLPEKYCSTANCQLPTANLYQWDELMDYSSVAGEKGLCPSGWHVPTEAEWQTLFSNYTNSAFAAAALKYSGFSGFNGLLSGIVPQNKNWQYQSFGIFYWTSTAYDPYKAWAHGFNEPDPSASSYPSSRENAFATRCLKD